jgi:hypothetical protein
MKIYIQYGHHSRKIDDIPFPMERIILQPTLDELQTGDKHLPELQRYIAHLVAGADRQVAAHNASLAYLALMQGFAAEGLLQLAWAPRLVFDLGEQEYEASQAFNAMGRN